MGTAKKIRIYLAGPMTGWPEFNYPHFNKCAAYLREAGFEVVNPAENFDGQTDLPKREYMRAAITGLLTCDRICFLQDAIHSEGARLEAQVAQAAGIPTLTELEQFAIIQDTLCLTHP